MSMAVYAGQGDADRAMALLWRAGGEAPRAAPGPKPALTVDLVVDAAIAVADAEGMAGLSLRAVGERVGRTAMALYTYVPSKTELIDLMYDRALGELPAGYRARGGWRPAVVSWADDLTEFYLRHPWVLQVSQARPVLGPNEFDVLETLLRVLEPAGLPAAVVRGVVASLFHFVRGAAGTIADSRQAAPATGVSDAEWWFARSALLADVAPDFAERFPLVAGLDGEQAAEPGGEASYLEQATRRAFETGLAIHLDGIEAAIGRAREDRQHRS
jgi:AcrR family transcriptional regulator